MRRAVALAALLSLPALAGERFDHQGALFAMASGGTGFAVASSDTAVPVTGIRWAGLAGFGLGFDGEGHEALLLARVTGRGSARDVAALLGLRGNFGDERWRTFFDLQLAVPLTPVLLAGPRIGAGVQFELAPMVGAFCQAGLQVGLGSAILFTGDVSCGLQLRTYVF